MAEATNTRTTVGNHETLRAVVASTLSELIDDQVYNLRPYAFYGDTGLEAVTLQNIRQAGQYAFANCSRLATVNLGYLHVLSSYLFSNCSKLDTVYAAETESAQTNCFAGCTNLVTIYMPELLSLASGMFQNCTKLTDVYVPKLKSGNSYAFSGCSSLEEIDLRNLTSVSYSMFSGCSKLARITLNDDCSTIGDYAFRGCSSLDNLSFPNVRSIGSYAFSGCSKLKNISIPKATSVSTRAFQDVPIGARSDDVLNLPSVTSIGQYIAYGNGPHAIDFGSRITFGTYSLAYAHNLVQLILRSSTMCSLANTNALMHTPLESGYGWIYVPEDLVGTYKAATNWSTFADRIIPLDEYPKDVIGTITDTWDEIATAEANGTYKTKYHINDTKTFLLNGYTYAARIIGFDKDDRSDGNGKAPITWMCIGLFPTGRQMNNNYGTSIAQNWRGSLVRSYLQDNVLSRLDEDLAPRIVEVQKNSRTQTTTGAADYDTTDDKLWVLSAHEVGWGGTGESGPVYDDVFSDDESRQLRPNAFATGDKVYWWTRTTSSDSRHCYLAAATARTVSNGDGTNTSYPGGDLLNAHCSNTYYFPICFCT